MDQPASLAPEWRVPEAAVAERLRAARRIVVKVGSSLVTNEGRGLDEAAIGQWSAQLSILVGQGREAIVVSSGAIAEGMKRLGWACLLYTSPSPRD